MPSDLDRYVKARDDFFALATKISVLAALIAFVVRARIAPKVDYAPIKWDALDFSYFVLIAPLFVFMGACVVYGRWLKLRAMRNSFCPGATALSGSDQILLDLPALAADPAPAKDWRYWRHRAGRAAAWTSALFGGLWYFIIPPLALFFVFVTLTDAYVLLAPKLANTEAACKLVSGGKWFSENGGFCGQGVWSAMLAFTEGNRFIHPSEPGTKFPWVYPQTQAWAIVIFLIAASVLGVHAAVTYVRQVLGFERGDVPVAGPGVAREAAKASVIQTRPGPSTDD